MDRFDDNYESRGSMRQKDLVLSTNEFVFIQSKTNGVIKTHTGPLTITISGQESMVTFNPKTKRFEETQDFEKARQIFTSAPEGWYVVLKNPTKDNSYPDAAKAVNSPDLAIGKKINIAGPCSFSLYPGQMAKVIQGHRLRSNQYLLARVYDADAARKGMKDATVVDAEGKEIQSKEQDYFVGQLLVIKGTEVSFYMPPTGIEVIPVGGKGNEYVRDAITLERLEYAILKDEDGEKRYIHGPAVVFPEPTETFVETPKGGNIFRALELSPISGIYVKVIADYKDPDGTEHKIGEELFITGNEQMIYYPRPEHAMIQYDGKYMHHAIAIPEGEGRYILDRLTGNIKTVVGPAMYLPDPRTEVVVKRKLSPKECILYYPGNEEVLQYNLGLSEKGMEKLANKGGLNNVINTAYSTSNQLDTLAIFEANANISRGVSYTKPRTITLDTKYDGVVSIDVWTGYAVNVVSKTGKREVVIGPKTRLLDYNETLEYMSLSTGKPKTTDNLLETAYLRIENNKISDVINVETKDFVNVQIKISYCVDFLEKYKEKWFSVENYVKYLCDHERSLIKREAKQHTIEDFYGNTADIIRKIALNIKDKKSENDGSPFGRLFKENGMLVKDVEVLSIKVQQDIASIINEHQTDLLNKTLELASAESKIQIETTLAELEKQEVDLAAQGRMYKLELDRKYEEERLAKEEAIKEKKRAMAEAEKQAEVDMQVFLNDIHAEEIARNKALTDATVERETKKAEIEKARQETYAATIEKIMKSVQPGLIEAMNARTNADLTNGIAQAVSPYSLAAGESVADTVNTLLRGTSMENLIAGFQKE